jgi:AcrR family transcriptional regulator
MEQELSTEVAAPSQKPLTNDDVMQTALKLFAQNGYFNTSLPDIKEKLGPENAQSLNQLFKTKQAIALAIRENILDSLSISIDDIRRRNRKASEQLREVVDLLFTLTDDAPEVIQFLLFMNHKEFLPDSPALMETPAFTKILRIIQAGIKEQEIRSLDPAIAYCYFFGIIQHGLQLILSQTLPRSADSYQPQIWQAAWMSIAKK